MTTHLYIYIAHTVHTYIHKITLMPTRPASTILTCIPAMDHHRSSTVQELPSDVLDELDHGVGVLGHTMVGPSSEEKVLQVEFCSGWVKGLMGIIGIRSYV